MNWFGSSVSLDGNTALVGATWWNSNQGAAYALTFSPFFSGEVFLGGSIYCLQFPDANLFGYYGYRSSSILYHRDMGCEVTGGLPRQRATASPRSRPFAATEAPPPLSEAGGFEPLHDLAHYVVESQFCIKKGFSDFLPIAGASRFQRGRRRSHDSRRRHQGRRASGGCGWTALRRRTQSGSAERREFQLDGAVSVGGDSVSLGRLNSRPHANGSCGQGAVAIRANPKGATS
jgi:FG-GAP repeat